MCFAGATRQLEMIFKVIGQHLFGGLLWQLLNLPLVFVVSAFKMARAKRFAFAAPFPILGFAAALDQAVACGGGSWWWPNKKWRKRTKRTSNNVVVRWPIFSSAETKQGSCTRIASCQGLVQACVSLRILWSRVQLRQLARRPAILIRSNVFSTDPFCLQLEPGQACNLVENSVQFGGVVHQLAVWSPGASSHFSHIVIILRHG